MTGEPIVTVCVPAYRSERVIAHTLRSIQAQTFPDLRVRIAVEPVDEGPVVDACRPFLEDPRFELVLNERRLGWDTNVAALISSVDTPYLCVQPHDDLMRPAYLETLLGALQARPDASVAYSDPLSFGASAGRRANVVPDVASRSERELGFFLAGAEGHPWRGVTRRDLLTRSFPTNQHQGFAVETEWALYLLQRGVALRSDQPLYLKRQYDRTAEDAVSIGWRFRTGPQELEAALEWNRAQLLAAIGPEEADGAARDVVLLAAEAAMLRRWQVIPGAPLPFGAPQLDRARRVLSSTAGASSPAAARIGAMVHLALSRHHAALDDQGTSLDHAQRAVECSPADREACLHLARLLLVRGRTDEALGLVLRVAASAPLDDGVLRLVDAVRGDLGRRYAAVEPGRQGA
jgi:hypothetical protein